MNRNQKIRYCAYPTRLLGAIIAATLLAGCFGSSEPSTGEKKGYPFLRCAGTRDNSADEVIKLPPLSLHKKGFDLKISGIANSIVTLGVLAGINEPNQKTKRNLSFFLDQFKAAKVQAIVVVGGLGHSATDAGSILSALSEAPVPVLVMPGAQESFDIFKKSVKKAQQKHPQIIDMTRVRRAKIKHISLLSLPGYFNPFYLEAKDQGCSYQPEDLKDIASMVEEDSLPVLLSPTPPRGQGPRATDMGRGNVNMGDPALAQLLAKSKISFGIFGHVYESGGHATSDDGKTENPEGVWHRSLFLQAGSADAVPVSLTNGGRSAGMAHVVEFSGKRGRFRPIIAGEQLP